MTELHIAQLTTWTPALGATVEPDGVRFRVWAPAARGVEVAIEGDDGPAVHPLTLLEEDGEWGGSVAGIGAGARYRFRLDGADAFPDPCSRSQPAGPHGPSEVVDPNAFAWTDDGWPGLTMDGLVIYELHVGTATPAGTFDALIERLPGLATLGVTAIELMPVAEFPGVRGWGYDGVDLFAPHHAYGGPEGLRRLVDAAHAAGLGVILDVIYNHLGPDGNYLRAFSPDYFTDEFATPWGEALNFGGRNSHRVREFVLTNAWRWVREFHIDGLRLDATHAIHDRSEWHILADLAARARTAGHPRSLVVIAEDERSDARLIRPPAGLASPGGGDEQGARRNGRVVPPNDGYGLDAVWADGFHHAVRVLLTGEREGYYAGFEGTTAEVARAIQDGFLVHGRRAASFGAGTTDVPASAFVFCIQNHDQVGNRALGERLSALIDPAAYRAASALLLLAPETPLLFMGQEFAASSPFLYFTDHEPALGRAITEGRRAEFAGFSAFTDSDRRAQIPDPQAAATYMRSKLDWAERERNAGTLALYTDLLALRRDDPVLREQDRDRLRASAPSAAVVAIHRWSDAGRRLVLVNLGEAADVRLDDVVGQMGAPAAWRVRWHGNEARYGGDGESPLIDGGMARLPAWTAVVLEAV